MTCGCVENEDGSKLFCPEHRKKVEFATVRLGDALQLVRQQAEDERLWLVPRPVTESSVAHLQEQLRALHYRIEGTYSNKLLESFLRMLEQ